MTYVLGTPAGERRVNGRAKLFRTLAEMSEQERRCCTVSGGGQTSRADAVYWSLAYRYGVDVANERLIRRQRETTSHR